MLAFKNGIMKNAEYMKCIIWHFMIFDICLFWVFQGGVAVILSSAYSPDMPQDLLVQTAGILAELAAHSSLSHCDHGLYYSGHMPILDMADQLLRELVDRGLRPVLTINEDVISVASIGKSSTLAVYKHYNRRRMSRLSLGDHDKYNKDSMPQSGPNEWCFVWIILVRNEAEAQTALSMTRNMVRSQWTGGSINKNIVFLLEPENRQHLGGGNQFFNNIYVAESLYMILNNSNKRRLPYTLFQFDPSLLEAINVSKTAVNVNKVHHNVTNNNNVTLFKSWSASLSTVRALSRKAEPLLPSFSLNFRGLQLTLSTMNWSQASVVIPDKREATRYRLADCFTKFMFDMLAERHNFSYSVTVPTDRQWGIKNPINGTWSGVVGSVAYQQVDFGTFSISDERNALADFTPHITIESFSFAMARPVKAPHWQNIFRPFQDAKTWLALASSLLAVVTALFFMQAIVTGALNNPQNSEDDCKGKMRMRHLGRQQSFWCLLCAWSNSMFVILHTVFSPKQNLFSISSKAINGFLILLCLYNMLIINCYKSSLISHLTKPTFSRLPSTLEELADSDMSWGVVNWGGLEAAFFASASTNLHRRINAKMTFCQDYKDCFDRAARGQFAYITFSFYQSNLISEDWMDGTTGEHKLVQASQTFNSPIPQVIGVQSGAPFLNAFGMTIIRLHDHGFFNCWSGILKRSAEQLGRQKVQINASHQHEHHLNSNERLTLQHLQAAFYFLGGGLLLATFVFIAECLIAVNF